MRGGRGTGPGARGQRGCPVHGCHWCREQRRGGSACVARCRYPCPPASPLPFLLQLFDDNLDGLISLDELREAFRRAAGATGKVEVPSDDVLRAMIAEVDGDGDGLLSQEDFRHVVQEAGAGMK